MIGDGGGYDTSKLLKIGVSYQVTSSPKIAQNPKNSPLRNKNHQHPKPLPLMPSMGSIHHPFASLGAGGGSPVPYHTIFWANLAYLRLFWGMMSLGKKYLFFATLKCHSVPPPSPITLIPIVLNFWTQK